MTINQQRPNLTPVTKPPLLAQWLMVLYLWPIMAAGQNTSYQAQFFSQYAPRNALEMVELLPGFNFDAGAQYDKKFGHTL